MEVMLRVGRFYFISRSAFTLGEVSAKLSHGNGVFQSAAVYLYP